VCNAEAHGRSEATYPDSDGWNFLESKLQGLEKRMRDKLIAAGVKNLREFGYPQCTKDNKGKAGADGWISLRERYPEHGQECVVATEDGAIQVATFFDTCGFVSDNPTGKLVEYWTPKSNARVRRLSPVRAG